MSRILYVCAKAGCFYRTPFVFCKRHSPIAAAAEQAKNQPVQSSEVPT